MTNPERYNFGTKLLISAYSSSLSCISMYKSAPVKMMFHCQLQNCCDRSRQRKPGTKINLSEGQGSLLPPPRYLNYLLRNHISQTQSLFSALGLKTVPQKPKQCLEIKTIMWSRQQEDHYRYYYCFVRSARGQQIDIARPIKIINSR